MSRVLAVLMLVVGLNATIAWADDDQKNEEAAIAAAEAWLKLVDDGRHADSWKESSEYFRNAITQEQWQQALKAVRQPLGKVGTRKIKSKTPKASLPGAPDGKYLVIEFDTAFEKKAEAVETITPQLEKDGKWRVSGYFIK